MSALNHATSYLPNFQATPTAQVGLNKVHDLTVNTYLNMDQCTLSFDLSHDLSTEFHWNTNQLFVYLVASYNETSNKRNEVTIWDNIITKKADAKFSGKLLVEYPLRDQHRELRGKDVRLHLRYRTMPIIGRMYEKEVAVGDFKVGKEYFRDGTIPQQPQGKEGPWFLSEGIERWGALAGRQQGRIALDMEVFR
eukprot:CAMPEP_0177184778 /NCGR_PEP_ID=MMETSP0367-20130122/17743_1 /TAXON_ID=447022 ORGANISM="Scrippsiella hangoei-like, Strain SHHI-4" /NCGR_SAMPLE_ID=MMETSP0367 /ASSEMBLY_ACC=CAM_ASM_000362 /LENGTH=193 /DNA_ID=CAMNT_0018631925 /DNA_START=161 /DNA_END=739 /DNA_ORIENTATION=-